MPTVIVNWMEGRSREQKQELVAGITEVLHRVGGSPVDRINVVLNDVPGDNWGRGGQLLSSVTAAPPPVDAPPPAPAAAPVALDGSAATALLGGDLRMLDLEQPRVQGMPVISVHQPGYLYVLHRRHGDDYRPQETGVRSSASGMIVCMEHSGTQDRKSVV